MLVSDCDFCVSKVYIDTHYDVHLSLVPIERPELAIADREVGGLRVCEREMAAACTVPEKRTNSFTDCLTTTATESHLTFIALIQAEIYLNG